VLTIYRRHLKGCPHAAERFYKRCKACPVWVQGVLNGEPIRKSLRTASWERAEGDVKAMKRSPRRSQRLRRQRSLPQSNPKWWTPTLAFTRNASAASRRPLWESTDTSNCSWKHFASVTRSLLASIQRRKRLKEAATRIDRGSDPTLTTFAIQRSETRADVPKLREDHQVSPKFFRLNAGLNASC